MIDRAQVKAIAKRTLENYYWLSVGLLALNSLVCGVCGAIPYVGQFAAMLVVPVLTVGYMSCCLRMVRGEKVEIGDLFSGFNNFGHNLGGYYWMALWIFLWSLLCYIPGIVKSFSYAMTPFILMDEPDIEAKEALEKSKQMMEGHKAELFVLYLSFIGWALLATFTCGIVGFFYVYPYMALASAVYYDLLKRQCGLFYRVVNNTNPVNPSYGADTVYSTNTDSIASSTTSTPAIGSVYTAGSISELIEEDSTEATSTFEPGANEEPVANEETVSKEEVEAFVNPIDAIINDYDAIEAASDVTSDVTPNTDSTATDGNNTSSGYDAFGDN